MHHCSVATALLFLALIVSASSEVSVNQDEQQHPLEHFSKLRVSQLQSFLKERGQQWDFAEKGELARAAFNAQQLPVKAPPPPPPPKSKQKDSSDAAFPGGDTDFSSEGIMKMLKEQKERTARINKRLKKMGVQVPAGMDFGSMMGGNGGMSEDDIVAMMSKMQWMDKGPPGDRADKRAPDSKRAPEHRNQETSHAAGSDEATVEEL